MEKYEEVFKLLLEAIQGTTHADTNTSQIPVGISNRHIHLSKKDSDCLFGEGYEFSKIKDLSQPGQYAYKETVTICGPKGAIEKVRILGPIRKKTQVEVLAGDSFKLGLALQPRLSGDLNNTPGVTIIGPKGSVQIPEGLIVAQRHIHMTPEDALHLAVHEGQVVSIRINGPRGGLLSDVAIRAIDNSALECHIDTEEANAMGINDKSKVTIVK